MDKDYAEKLKEDLKEIIHILDEKKEKGLKNDFTTLLLLDNKMAMASACLRNKLTTTIVE